MENINKSPFSLYDFLGYFIPGAFFCYLFAIAFNLEANVWLSFNFFDGLRAFDKSVVFVIISYVLGHALNYLSSLTIERYSIWSIGYPSKFILGEKQNSYFKRLKNKDDCVERKKRKKELRISFIWRFVLLIVVLPIFIIDTVVGKLFGFRNHYTNSVDSTLKNIIEKRLEQFKIKHKFTVDSGEDYFRVIWHYYYEYFGPHVVKLDKYVALYGFTRSVSFIFCVYSRIILCALLVNGVAWYYSLIGYFLSAALSYIFYIAFVKFYRRFTLEGFMCLVIDKDLAK